MGFENRKKSGRIFSGSKLNVPGQGIYSVVKQSVGPNQNNQKDIVIKPSTTPKSSN